MPTASLSLPLGPGFSPAAGAATDRDGAEAGGGAAYGVGMTIPIGAHVDNDDPIAHAQARGASVAQIFLGDPQSYRGPVVAYAAGAAGLRAATEAAGIGLYVHAPYPINVASTNNRIRIPGRKLLQQHLLVAAEIGALGVIVHGGHLGAAEDAAVGFDNWRKCVDGLDLPVPLLLENTAGGENAMARRLEAIARLWDALGTARGGDRVGFCLDTCHAHAGGLELGDVVDRIRAITGRIDLVHTNDSRDVFDSGADRHTNFGSGHIDGETLADVVRAAGAPVVCETPGGVAGQAADIAWLRARV